MRERDPEVCAKPALKGVVVVGGGGGAGGGWWWTGQKCLQTLEKRVWARPGPFRIQGLPQQLPASFPTLYNAGDYAQGQSRPSGYI